MQKKMLNSLLSTCLGPYHMESFEPFLWFIYKWIMSKRCTPQIRLWKLKNACHIVQRFLYCTSMFLSLLHKNNGFNKPSSGPTLAQHGPTIASTWASWLSAYRFHLHYWATNNWCETSMASQTAQHHVASTKAQIGKHLYIYIRIICHRSHMHLHIFIFLYIYTCCSTNML